MTLLKDGNTTIVLWEKGSMDEFIVDLRKSYPEIKKDNLIINLLSFTDLKAAQILQLEPLSATHRATNKSFVLVTGSVSYGDVPDQLVVVPTLQEAKDLIEMEEIERDLGI